ncbi:MAG: molybdopterin-binding protein, partial [Myxococcota bacterium]
FAAAALAELGSMAFHKIRMKPGKPLAFGHIGAIPVLGLPGNPVSSFVGFELFGRPLLRALGGHAHLHRSRLRCRLGRSVKRNRTRPEYVRGAFEGECFVPHLRQGSGDLSSVLRVEGLAVIEAGEGWVQEDQTVTVIDMRANL